MFSWRRRAGIHVLLFSWWDLEGSLFSSFSRGDEGTHFIFVVFVVGALMEVNSRCFLGGGVREFIFCCFSGGTLKAVYFRCFRVGDEVTHFIFVVFVVGALMEINSRCFLG